MDWSPGNLTTAGSAAPPPFAGRAAELAQLAAALDRAGTRGAQLVAVVGEPGIGKTRLLREWAAALPSGTLVLPGAATEFEQQVPFGAVRAALDGFRPAVVAGLGAQQVAVLGELFPSLPASSPDGGRPAAERLLLYRAVRDLLAGLAADRPVVLILDDMHWADDASVELCRHLLRHPPGGAVAIAVAYRLRQAGDGLAALVGDAESAGRLVRVPVKPLAFTEADPLLGPALDDDTRRRLYRLSEGNPLYLEALSRAPSVVDGAGLPDLGMPVQAALRREFDVLPGPTRTVLHAAAVAGDTFDPVLAGEVAEVSPEALASALDALIRRDLIRRDPVRPVDGRLRFRHPLTRAAAYRSSGAGWRIGAHARAAAALRKRGAPAADLVHHVERSAQPGDPDAAATLLAAADAAVATAPAVAAYWYRATLRLLPAGGPGLGAGGPGGDAARLEILQRLAAALGMSGRLAESRDVLHELLALLPRAGARRAHAATFCAMIERLLGRYAEANAILESELDDLPDRTGATAAIIQLGLAFGHMLRGDLVAKQDWAAQAAAIARRVADPGLLGAALGVQALCIIMGVRVDGAPVGDRREALTLLAEAATITDELPDSAIVDHIEAYAVLGSAEFLTERLDAAERHLRRVLRVAQATGRVHLQTNTLLGLGSLYGRTARLREALRCFDDALDWAVVTGSDEQRNLCQSSRSWILAWLGDLAGATEAADEAAGLAGRLPGFFSASTRRRLATLRFYSGDPDRCVEMLLQGCGGPDLPTLDPLSRLTAYCVLAAAEIERDRPDAALDWARRAGAIAEHSPLSTHRGLGRLALATALAGTDPVAGGEHAERAIAAFAEVRDDVFVGFARLAAGRCQAARGETRAALAQWQRAHELFAACDAKLLVKFAERARRSVAEAPAGAGSAVAELTDREREIAELVATGLTNRQIAERLFLSARTVDAHVARLFKKLGVSRRSAVIGALRANNG